MMARWAFSTSNDRNLDSSPSVIRPNMKNKCFLEFELEDLDLSDYHPLHLLSGREALSAKQNHSET